MKKNANANANAKAVLYYAATSKSPMHHSPKALDLALARQVAEFERNNAPSHIRPKVLTVPEGKAILLMQDTHAGVSKYTHPEVLSAAKRRARKEKSANPNLEVTIVAA